MANFCGPLFSSNTRINTIFCSRCGISLFSILNYPSTSPIKTEEGQRTMSSSAPTTSANSSHQNRRSTSGINVIKFVLVGECSVGKTALLLRFVDKQFIAGLKATTGADFKNKKCVLPSHKDEGEVSLQIWDTAGQERSRVLARTYYRGCEGALLVFDVTSRRTFEQLDFWLEGLLEGTGRTSLEGFSVFVVGNKMDLPGREVTEAEATKWCDARGLSYMECSAKAGTNVDAAFFACASCALDYRENMGDEMLDLLNAAPAPVMVGKGGRTNNGKKCAC